MESELKEREQQLPEPDVPHPDMIDADIDLFHRVRSISKILETSSMNIN